MNDDEQLTLLMFSSIYLIFLTIFTLICLALIHNHSNLTLQAPFIFCIIYLLTLAYFLITDVRIFTGISGRDYSDSFPTNSLIIVTHFTLFRKVIFSMFKHVLLASFITIGLFSAVHITLS